MIYVFRWHCSRSGGHVMEIVREMRQFENIVNFIQIESLRRASVHFVERTKCSSDFFFSLFFIADSECELNAPDGVQQKWSSKSNNVRYSNVEHKKRVMLVLCLSMAEHAATLNNNNYENQVSYKMIDIRVEWDGNTEEKKKSTNGWHYNYKLIKEKGNEWQRCMVYRTYVMWSIWVSTFFPPRFQAIYWNFVDAWAAAWLCACTLSSAALLCVCDSRA